MYLFTMVFIFLTIFGVFTEIVTLQNNRFAAMKTGGAQQLVTWHSAVVTAARYTRNGTAVFPTWGTVANPCSVMVTAQVAPAAAPACQDALAANAKLDALVIAIGPTVTLNLLPVAYDTVNTRFNSIILTDASGTNSRVAITFIGPAATADTPIAPTGMTTSQIYRQLIRSNIDRSSFGYVNANVIQPSAQLDPSVSGAYNIPAALVGTIPSGAIALFTPL